MDLRMHRRKFIASSPLLLLGARYLDAATLSLQSTPKGSEISEELSPGELEIVKNSTMASNIQNFFSRGYSCAESGLAVGLRHLEKPDDLVWAAAGFGGGLHHADLCGFLTGGARGSVPRESKSTGPGGLQQRPSTVRKSEREERTLRSVAASVNYPQRRLKA
jgi:hypothetical protein